VVTADTNIAVYALTEGSKADRAETVLAASGFLSVQVLNEYALVSQRKLRHDWDETRRDIELLRRWVGDIRPIMPAANQEALRIAQRYRLAIYDAVMVAVAASNGATTLYSEDMQHGLVIDEILTITNPFLPTEPQ
jgi:predicted nucleic acid-binding protein